MSEGIIALLIIMLLKASGQCIIDGKDKELNQHKKSASYNRGINHGKNDR